MSKYWAAGPLDWYHLFSLYFEVSNNSAEAYTRKTLFLTQTVGEINYRQLSYSTHCSNIHCEWEKNVLPPDLGGPGSLSSPQSRDNSKGNITGLGHNHLLTCQKRDILFILCHFIVTQKEKKNGRLFQLVLKNHRCKTLFKDLPLKTSQEYKCSTHNRKQLQLGHNGKSSRELFARKQKISFFLLS